MTGGKKNITIHDLAVALGVSSTTVSRALHDHPSISQKTTVAVKKMAEKMGYLPNTLASGLRKQQTNTLGVIVPWINRPFIASLISGIEEVANAAGYNVIISQSNDLAEKEKANAETLFANRVEGIIVSLAMETLDVSHFEVFRKRGIPFVLVDRVSDQLETDQILIDNFSAAFEATRHLLEKGCKRIAHLAGAQHRHNYAERRKGYEAALREFGNTPVPSLVWESGLSAQDGWQAAEYWMSNPQPPDGIFSANDTTAVSVIQYAKAHGIAVPEELSVVGFNNDPISTIISPSLTTVDHPAVTMGKLAAEQLVRQAQSGQVQTFEKKLVTTRLIERESTGNPSPIL